MNTKALWYKRRTTANFRSATKFQRRDVKMSPRRRCTATPRCIILLRKLALGSSPLKYLTTIHPVAASYAVSSAMRVKCLRHTENRISVASGGSKPLEHQWVTKCTVPYDGPATAHTTRANACHNVTMDAKGGGWGRGTL